MGSEKSADHASDFLSSWFWVMTGGCGTAGRRSGEGRGRKSPAAIMARCSFFVRPAMREAPILSTPSRPEAAGAAVPAAARAARASGPPRAPDKPADLPRLPPRAHLFDLCQIGVVLRTVLLVEAVVAVTTLYVAADLGSWLLLAATVTGGALPATLLWLVTACASGRRLARRPLRLQYLSGTLLGLMAGL